MSVRTDRPPYLWAAVTALAVLLVYTITLAPTTAFWDTSEYIAAAHVLGIPHPPGNPLFTITAHVFGLIPVMGSFAERINLFAAVTSAGAAGLWFLVAERWLQPIVEVRWARLLAAAAGIIVSAFSWTVWNQSTVNEKVYTVSLLAMALVTWLAVHWGDDEPGPHRDRWLVLIVYVIALSSTNHMMGVLAAPAVAVYVLWTSWRTATQPWVVMVAFALALALAGHWTTLIGPSGFNADWRTWGVLVYLTPVVIGYAIWRAPGDFRNPLLYVGIAAVVVGVSLNYVYLPMRAGQLPPINEGEPTTWQALLDVLNRVQYAKPPLTFRQADVLAQYHNYLQYFNWQFARDWGTVGRLATLVFTMLGLSGLVTLLRKDLRAGLAATAMLGVLTVALVFYLNFKYGFSLYPDRPELATEVRERDYFFMGSFAYFGVLVAVGFGAAQRAIVEFLRQGGFRTERNRWALSCSVLVLAFVPLFGNRITASRAHETLARDVAIDLLQSVEPYGILVTAGDNDTFPLWYAQEVEGIRQDVTLANLSLMNTEWHLKQLRRRETPTFDPAGAAELWRGRAWPKPTTPVLSVSEATLDSLPELVPVEPGLRIPMGDVQIRLGRQYLERKDIAMIWLIRDNLGHRSINFAWSAASYPDADLGLNPYLVSQGLVRELFTGPVAPDDSIVDSQGLGYMNIPRTQKLLWDVYRWPSVSRDRPRGWVDPPSGSILQLYAIVYQGSGAALRVAGDATAAARADSIAVAIQANLLR